MAGSVNKVIIIGNLGRDPEIRSLQNGGRVANLAVATSESWKDKQTGERRERTEWHRVVVFNEGLVNLCERYLKKGSKVYIEGQLETRKWEDQAGNERFITEVVMRPYRSELSMLDSRQDGERQGQGQRSASAPDQGNRYGSPGRNEPPADDLDDEIPF